MARVGELTIKYEVGDIVIDDRGHIMMVATVTKDYLYIKADGLRSPRKLNRWDTDNHIGWDRWSHYRIQRYIHNG